MQRSCFCLPALMRAAVLAALCAGCNLISPLHPLVASQDGGADADGDGGVPSADAGACSPAKGAACDPLAQCGCGAGERCTTVDGTAKCQSIVGGREGARCRVAAPCADGLECSVTGLCAKPCSSNLNCSAGACALLPRTSVGDAGVRVCVKNCDPLALKSCGDGATCVPTADLSSVGGAFCKAIRPAEALGRASVLGAACVGHNDCAAGLGCAPSALDGSGVCTPWCRGDGDCPKGTPVCDLVSSTYFAGAGDQVGQCAAAAPSDASCSLDDPPVWMRGKVWTRDEFTDCLSRCPMTDIECMQANCPDATEFLQCLSITQTACLGKSTGKCRAEYVEHGCCLGQFCTGAADADACDQQYCATSSTAWNTCVSADQGCVFDVAPACVE